MTDTRFDKKKNIRFTYQNGSLLEVEDCLLIIRNDALFYRIKNQKDIQGYEFLSFAKTYQTNMGKKLLDTATTLQKLHLQR